jgi:hypothetical protein
MKTIIATLAVAGLVAGCSSSTSSSVPTRLASVQAMLTASAEPTPTPTSYGTARQAAAGACAAFQTFYGDMSSAPPRENWQRLIGDANAVDFAAFQASQETNDDATYESLYNDAEALLTYVSDTDFPHSGNILGEPVQTMQDDCPT